jgi:hypothetical protein
MSPFQFRHHVILNRRVQKSAPPAEPGEFFTKTECCEVESPRNMACATAVAFGLSLAAVEGSGILYARWRHARKNWVICFFLSSEALNPIISTRLLSRAMNVDRSRPALTG